jgi:hypothetical protein
MSLAAGREFLLLESLYITAAAKIVAISYELLELFSRDIVPIIEWSSSRVGGWERAGEHLQGN